MFRFIPGIGLLLGSVLLLGSESPLSAQQFRSLQANPATPQVPLNNFNFQRIVTNPNGVGSNVVNGANAGVGQTTQPMNNANAIINGLNNGTIGNGANGQFTNPYTTGINSSPYANAALDPTNYNMMNYGNPYGIPPGTPINPFYNPMFNPYPFLPPNSVGMAGPQVQMPSPAQLYNYNFNFAYLSNPYLNPLSNPAFSGPFPAGAFNAGTALNLMGAGNILQNFPLPTPNFNGPSAGNNNNNNNNNNPFP
jgi:hypothetical protein